ncbi:MAG: type II toxin-antitoxin system VapC family toxin [Roseiarcus sp.]
MMVDASAIVAVLNREAEGPNLAAAIEAAEAPFTSPLAIFEAAAALMRENELAAGEADAAVREFLDAASIRVVPISDAMASAALEAFGRFGKGRHPARLNLGDCFAYACARAYRAPLLYKGGDFVETDVNDEFP